MTTTRSGRSAVLRRLAEGMARRAHSGMLRVAVDGPDHAGKTTFARDLVDALRPLVAGTAEVRRFSTDDHMLPIQVRRSAIAADPNWLYHHAFDLDQIREIAEGLPELDPPGSILVVDGMMLQRSELAGLWHTAIYLDVPEEVVLRRVVERDYELFDTLEEVLARYRERYFPALRIYQDAVGPAEKADVLIDMADYAEPRVLRWDGY